MVLGDDNTRKFFDNIIVVECNIETIIDASDMTSMDYNELQEEVPK